MADPQRGVDTLVTLVGRVSTTDSVEEYVTDYLNKIAGTNILRQHSSKCLVNATLVS